MTITPPGWYDDGRGALRWWDGTQWTEHVAQPDAEDSPAPTEAEIVAEHDAASLGGLLQPADYPAAAAGYSAQPGEPAAVPYPPGEGQALGAYPGAATGGAFAAATEPRTSKLWIVWVVLGVVLLGIVIAAAVLIPLLFLSATANGGAQSDDERAAIATVELYDDAWQNGDCDSFSATTTEQFRADTGFPDCAAFESDAAAFDENFDEYEVNVTDVETIEDQITVTTNETYTALVDENGEPTDPTDGATVYHYTLVQSGGEWVIDDLYYE